MSTKAQPATPIAVGPADAARMLSLSRTQVYRLVSAGELRICKVGSRSLLPVADLERWLERRLAGSHADRP